MTDNKPRPAVDSYDLAILAALSADAELTSVELSKLVHLSRTAVTRRITALRDRGILSGARYEIAFEKLGFAIRALVSISAPPTVDSWGLLDRLMARPEVLDVSMVLGDELLVAEVIAVDTSQLHDFLTWIHDTGYSETRVILKKHRSTIDFRTRMQMVEDMRDNPDPRLSGPA
ncbi:MAG: Lrp/AsnC family transcriptional regulator [Woeseiaceae bacterium]|jgi:DNA-binding Lrp family transcriptional regulator|nr:Lrp/AsnC family transcriptional regulator [Woeseiaceae bacterium]